MVLLSAEGGMTLWGVLSQVSYSGNHQFGRNIVVVSDWYFEDGKRRTQTLPNAGNALWFSIVRRSHLKRVKHHANDQKLLANYSNKQRLMIWFALPLPNPGNWDDEGSRGFWLRYPQCGTWQEHLFSVSTNHWRGCGFLLYTLGLVHVCQP